MDLAKLTPALQLLAVVSWTLFWKGWALWKSSRNEQRNWFIILLVVNTLGIAEIAYLVFFQKKDRLWEKIQKLWTTK